jgi:hypothetical protein
MAPPRVQRDPNHPDFPHGTPKGFTRGCGCGPCDTAEKRRRKNRRVAIARGARKGGYVTAEEQARVTAHVKSLLAAVPTATMHNVLEAADLAPGAQRAIRGEKHMAISTARKCMAVTTAKLAAHCRFATHEQLNHLVRTMQALGYPMSWQEAQAGVDLSTTLAKKAATPIGKYEKLVALSRRVGDVPATPESTGISQRGITRAKHEASSRGFYPPMCYDENGALDYRAIPEHPWSKADEKAHRRIALVRTIVENFNTHSHREIAHVAGRDAREVERIIDRYKLKRDASRLPKRLAWLRTQLDRFDADVVDPVRFCLEIDLGYPDQFVKDHPGVLSWLADNPDWQRPNVVSRLRNKAAHQVEQEQVAA